MGASHSGEQSILVPQTTTPCGGGKKERSKGVVLPLPLPPLSV